MWQLAHITVNSTQYVRTQTFTDCKVYLFLSIRSYKTLFAEIKKQ